MRCFPFREGLLGWMRFNDQLMGYLCQVQLFAVVKCVVSSVFPSVRFRTEQKPLALLDRFATSIERVKSNRVPLVNGVKFGYRTAAAWI